MTHRCPISTCPVKLPDHLLMCRPHWYQTPRDLRDAVWDAYQNGAGIGSDELAEAQLAAIAAVESRRS